MGSERTIKGSKLEKRTIQVGASRHLINEYNTEGIVEITDISLLVKKINALRKVGKYKEAKRLLPKEKIYVLPIKIEKKIEIKS